MPDRLLRPGQVLGNYRIVRLLGKGGFAEVHLGRHIHLNTYAAIKLLHTQLERADIAKFRREAQIVATLRHPHIVTLFDFDIIDGAPYLVMDYAPEGTLRQRHPHASVLPPATVQDYITEVGAALDFAHDKGFIHRDVKPENMLIGARGELLLSDFGIATVVAHSLEQDTPTVAGTVAYMAPEQLNGKPRPASDLYSLGVVVYEWLCGQRPFNGSFAQLVNQHLNAAPPPLRSLNPGISPALEEVVMIALAKAPAQRFQTVGDFVHDFRLALKHAPPRTSVRPPAAPATRSTRAPGLDGEDMTRLGPREQSASASPGVEQDPRTGTVRATRSVPPRATAANSVPDGPRPPGTPMPRSRGTVPTDYRPRPTSRRALLVTLGGLAAAGAIGGALALFSRSRTNVSTGGHNGSGTTPTPRKTVQIGETIYKYTGHSSYVYTLAWSPDGKRVASGSADHTAQVWDARNGNNEKVYALHQDWVYGIAWSRDGNYIASGSFDRTAQVWDATTIKLLIPYRKHTDHVLCVAWSPDGKYVVSGSADLSAQVWEAATGNTVSNYKNHSSDVMAVSWSPNGSQIASGSRDRTVQVWEPSSEKPVYTHRAHTEFVYAVAWSPDGGYIASGGNDKTVRVWIPGGGADTYIYQGHKDAVYSVAWSPDGKRIASASQDGTVHIWNALDGGNVYIYSGHKGFVHAVAWHEIYIASGGEDKTVRIWQAG